jgi:hypothetical protein
MRFIALLFLLVCSAAFAQSAATKEFPADAQALSVDELKQALSGKVFMLSWVGAPAWRMEFKDDGYIFFNAGTTNGSGTWRAESGKVCTDMRAFGNNCNDVRKSGDLLYYKRLSGEVIAMAAK